MTKRTWKSSPNSTQYTMMEKRRGLAPARKLHPISFHRCVETKNAIAANTCKLQFFSILYRNVIRAKLTSHNTNNLKMSSKTDVRNHPQLLLPGPVSHISALWLFSLGQKLKVSGRIAKETKPPGVTPAQATNPNQELSEQANFARTHAAAM